MLGALLAMQERTRVSVAWVLPRKYRQHLDLAALHRLSSTVLEWFKIRTSRFPEVLAGRYDAVSCVLHHCVHHRILPVS